MTLPAPPTNILLRIRRVKRKNSADKRWEGRHIQELKNIKSIGCVLDRLRNLGLTILLRPLSTAPF
jgi:hypothetical protein